ncbi:hypothetical protein UFOVP347_34 [uncultured Caudovirales phage]|uniref:Uncharacterized protein n=1 Tax=uncultured Caudovirales phage TaxID=2100421 RepID=A0A6J5M032_9CAUD|nr:hypothetical protein UFOVP347_34 [uncultured Caudovirales phage]
MAASVRFTTEADIRHVASRLQPACLREIQALGHQDPMPPLMEGLRSGKITLTAEDAEEPFCVFGVAPSPYPSVGMVWMVNTPRMLRHRRQFIREGNLWLPALHAFYPTLGNIVHAENTDHIRWLDRLGFTLIQTLTLRGEAFISFSRTTRRV